MSGHAEQGLGSGSKFMPGNYYHVDIPESDRLEDDDAEAGDLGWDPTDFPLDGRTLQEVQIEAKRIRLGEVFISFEQFDRCIDSWGVLNHRGVQRYKTSKDLYIRNCRFGKKPNQRYNSPKSIDSGALVQETHCEDDVWEDSDDLWEESAGTPGKENRLGGLQAATQVHSQEELGHRLAPASQREQEDIDFQNEITQMTAQAKARQPLKDLQSNRPSGNISSVQNPPKRPKSIVKHTSQWLPGRRGLVAPEGGKSTKKQSVTGACGELTRFRPRAEEDPDTFSSEPECPFYVRSICKKTTGVITINKCDLTHNCPQQLHRWRGPASKARWLAETLAPRVIRSVKGPVRELTVGFQQDYKRTTSYHQMWRAKDLVRDAYLGGQRKSFHCIPGLIRKLKLIDPGCKAEWSSVDDCGIFERAFICPSACRDALKYCQPVVSLDACHSKNRKFPIQIFLATVLDSNMEILPLCYGIAPTENHDNWRWFLQHMDGAVTGIEQLNVPAMSDRCKGLVQAVREVFPGKVHGMCAQHLRANVKNNFGKPASDFFLATVYANTSEQFLKIIERLERSLAKGKAAGEYIRKLDAKLYARHAFPLPRFGHVTSNPCEATNSGLLNIREYAPFKLLVEMWYYIQTHFNSSRSKAAAWKHSLTKPAFDRHTVNLGTFGQFQVFDDCGGSAKVQTTTGSEEYLVQLGTRPSCTCFELQEMCWPCEHIMAWDDMLAKPFSDRFHLCWRTSSWRSCYEGIVPSFLCNDIRPSNLCWPPEVAKKKGRHRVVRIASGSRVSRAARSGEDVLTDALGNLYLQYPIDDNSDLQEGLPTAETNHSTQTAPEKPKRKKAGTGKTSCRLCSKVGHNRRTCPLRTALGTDSSPQASEGPESQVEVNLSFPPQSQAAEFEQDSERYVGIEDMRDLHTRDDNAADLEYMVGLYRATDIQYTESDPELSEEEDDSDDLRNVDFRPVLQTTPFSEHDNVEPW